MKGRNYQKLEEPQLIELEGEYGFVIASHVDISKIKFGLLFLKGKSYNYENMEMTDQGLKEVQYSLHEDGYFELDENGKIID